MGFCGDFTGWHRLEQLNFEGTLRTLGAGDPGTQTKSLFHCLLNIAGHQVLPARDRRRDKVTFSQLIKKILTIFPNSHVIQQVNKIDFPSRPPPQTSAGGAEHAAHTELASL